MEREFKAPGPGTWVLDTTHNAAAMTLFAGEVFGGLSRGFKECCARYGLMMSHLQPSFQHGFMYMQQVGVVGKPEAGPPPPFLMKFMFKIHPVLRSRVKAANKSFTERLWLEDLKIWDEMKQDSIARNTALQSVDLDAMSDAELAEHLQACRDNAEEMIYRHHKFTVGSILPIGRLLDVATRNSGLSAAQVAPLLKGSTPVSTGIAGEELQALANAVCAAGMSRDELEGMDAELAVAMLRRNEAVASALDAYLGKAGYMLVGGYDISEQTLRESPNIILSRILDALSPRPAAEFDKELENRIRSAIPEQDREEFEIALEDARKVNRMRDERGVYNDIWGSGIARTAVLGVGRRLVEKGLLDDAELALEASFSELLGVLRGQAAPEPAVLKERQQWRRSKKIDEVPPFLGMAPSDPPPLDLLPEAMRPSMRAFATVMGNVFDSPDEPDASKISGLPVSPGVCEGTARVIITTREFDRLQEGDILVTKNTSAGFNVVLPLISALVTDRGGILSHAAIVSREYGIPGVIGTKVATQQIKDGDRIRVDGDKGEVTILS